VRIRFFPARRHLEQFQLCALLWVLAARLAGYGLAVRRVHAPRARVGARAIYGAGFSPLARFGEKYTHSNVSGILWKPVAVRAVLDVNSSSSSAATIDIVKGPRL
jgi:hypothetical protein